MEREYLFKFALRLKAGFIFRGVRNAADFEYEKAIAAFNEGRAAEVRTVFLVPPHDVGSISSSFVKGLIGYEGWERMLLGYVPAPVASKITMRHHYRSEASLLK